MIEFILNDNTVKTDERSGQTLLDFIRYQRRLIGTKIGCREGDCGACTILIGELVESGIQYKSATSCITPLGNVAGKHVVTVEGINMDVLTPYQQAMVDASGTQCGMCTVGFVMSLAGLCLTRKSIQYSDVISAIDGNICRCTGYKSIERAAYILYEKLQNKPSGSIIPWLVNNEYIPAYFLSMDERLRALHKFIRSEGDTFIGGGTDLLVQKHDEIFTSDINLISDNSELVGISIEDNIIEIGAATNTTMLLDSPILNQVFPKLREHLLLVSSTPIRNIATVGGNFINASPIGDLTVFFIALNTTIELAAQNDTSREILLKDLYLDYKKLDMHDGEHMKKLRFQIPDKPILFNFEKVSKRRYLDIATVNTAACFKIDEEECIVDVHISAGGVGPVPMYLNETCQFLIRKKVTHQNMKTALETAQKEISPISDVRGSAQYKRLLLNQLLRAHFFTLFPDLVAINSSI